MFFEEPRTDGLLRGPRAERTEWITALADAPWDLERLLELNLGLLDHAQDVRVAAMEALRSIARKKPDAIAVTAVELLAYFMHSFTVASGVNLATFQCLVELNTAESLEVVKATIESGRGSNDQFARWVNILQDANGLEILRTVDLAKLSRTRRSMISRVLARESGTATA